MHPACCKHPETCTLTYREHLLGVVLGASAIPSRAINRTPGQPDEPAVNVDRRQARWERDGSAFKQMHAAGVRGMPLDGAADHMRKHYG